MTRSAQKTTTGNPAISMNFSGPFSHCMSSHFDRHHWLTSWTFRSLWFGIEAKLSASRSSDENPFAEVPDVKDMRAFASIGNLQTEIEMKEFYDVIIMTPRILYLRNLWASFSCFLCLFLVSDPWVKKIWTCLLQVDDRSGNSWAVGACVVARPGLTYEHDMKIHWVWSCFHLIWILICISNVKILDPHFAAFDCQVLESLGIGSSGLIFWGDDPGRILKVR